MITAFATRHGLTCPDCVLRAHGSLTVRRHHGATVACDHRGAPLTEEGGIVAGSPILAVQGSAVMEGQQCIRCQEGLKGTELGFARIVHRAADVLSHHRARRRGASRLIEPLRSALRPHQRSLRADPTSNGTSA